MWCDRDFIAIYDGLGNKQYEKLGGEGWHNVETVHSSIFQYGVGCNHQYYTSYMSKNDLQMNPEWYQSWSTTYDADLSFGFLSDKKESTLAGSIGSNYSGDSIQLGQVWVKKPGKNSDIILTRLDSSGNYLWFKTAGGDWDESVTAITVDNSDNIFVQGYISNAQGIMDTVAFDAITLIGGSSTTQYFIARLIPPTVTNIHVFAANESLQTIYPNPTTGLISIASRNGMIPSKVNVFNSHGTLISTTKNTSTLNLKDLPKGIYTVQAVNEKYTATHRIILSD